MSVISNAKEGAEVWNTWVQAGETNRSSDESMGELAEKYVERRDELERLQDRKENGLSWTEKGLILASGFGLGLLVTLGSRAR